jgi:hypothetical protein
MKEKGGASGIYEGEAKLHAKFWWGNLKENDHYLINGTI